MSDKKTTAKGERMRVLQVRARNMKCVKEVEIDMKGGLHEIKGDSGQGKTTILASIEAGLRGIDKDLVRNGADEAEVELHLSEAVINRVLPRDGKEKLMVTDAAGNPIEAAKAFLATICGPTAFRPIEWVQLGGGPKKGSTERRRAQRDQLIEAIPMALTAAQVANAVKNLGEEYAQILKEVNLAGVDFEQHAFVACDMLRTACSDYFSLQNSREKDAQAELKHTPAPERSAPKASVEECSERVNAAQEAFIAARTKQDGRQHLTAQVEALRMQVAEGDENLPKPGDVKVTKEKYERLTVEGREKIQKLEAALLEARTALKDAEEKLQRCEKLNQDLVLHEARKKDLAALEAEIAGEGETVDLEALQAELEHAKADLEARKLQDRHNEAAKKAQYAADRLGAIKRLVELFRDDLPKTLLAQAELPVQGLSIDGEQILIDGVPLHQLGTSQQIRVGVLIASALNPASGFVLVDGAESMGRNDRKALAEAAQELGLQLIMTYVDPDATPAPGVTVMRDGEAVEPLPPAA